MNPFQQQMKSDMDLYKSILEANKRKEIEPIAGEKFPWWLKKQAGLLSGE